MTSRLRHVIAVAALLLLALGAHGGTVEAQTPPPGPPPTDAQILAVEHQLLCPLCTNERLDVCTLAICADMKQVIRERLAAGSTPDDIVLYFQTRYGPRVRADLQPSGFNLWLFGWVGGAVLLTGAAAAYMLLSMRRASQRRAHAAATSPTAADVDTTDDRWLDALIDDAPREPHPPGDA